MKKQLKIVTILGAFSLLLTACNFFAGESGSSINAPKSSSKQLEKYMVLWKNYDGILLEIDENVLEGTVPTYDGPTPVKQSDEQHEYIFDGWTKTVEPASGDTEYFAKFKEETRKYTITWKNYDGAVLGTDQVPYGIVPTYSGDTPTKAQTTERTYTFEKWSPELKEAKGDITYTAQFKDEARKYQITWKNDDGTVIKTDEVPYGTKPVYEGDEPLKESTPQLTYKFKEWSPSISVVSGDAEYVATFESETRKYTITWKNYDGTILEVDTDAKYGELPKYDGATPKRNKGQGFEYTFSGWTPSILYVSGDAEYVAKYSTTPSFCFDTWNYELENGVTLSQLTGAPWINSNVKGELYKIKKPSLRDDFYASVNYEDIKSGETTVFDECDYLVDEAFEKINNGTTGTVNGDVLYQSFTKMVAGDIDSLKNDLADIDVDKFTSSKAMFAGNDPFARLIPTDSGYELEYNDGYMNGATGLPQLYIYSKYYPGQYEDGAKNLVRAISNLLNLGFNTTDVSNIVSNEGTLCATAYQTYRNSGDDNGSNTYTLKTLPWARLKSAAIDLGLPESTRITMKKYYANCFNTFYNSYVANQSSLLLKMIKMRYAFDNRFIVGASNYKNINSAIVSTGFFNGEYGMGYGSDAEVGKALAKHCFAILNEQAYIALEGDEEIKQMISDLIEDILEEYIKMADDSWLGAQTKQKMKSKLQHMNYGSCYSDGFKNFPNLVFTDLDNASAYDILEKYHDAELQTIVDKTIDLTGYWDDFHSYTVNAYYSPAQNIFVILNGIVKGTIGETIEERYGMIGAIIGHEITHAFDSSGSQFDENGNYANWWTSADKSAFNKKVNNMVSFYNKITLKKGLKVDGDNVNGEATADMGGVKVMLRLAKEIEDFDYQEFFKAYAKVWCDQVINANEVESRAQDAHPFNYLRCNVTLAQFDEFIEAFDIQPGDGMYIPENERIAIW